MSITDARPASKLLQLLAAGTILLLGGIAVAEQTAAQGALAECTAARCLGLQMSAELVDEMQVGDGASVEALARGLQVRYDGEEPLSVQLIAARYQDGRLVRYRVSPRQEISPGAEPAALEHAMEALEGAFRPVTERDMFVTPLPDPALAISRIAMESMVGNLPPTYLVGQENGPGLLAIDGAGSEPPDNADNDAPDNPENEAPAEDEAPPTVLQEGALGVVALLPEHSELRAFEETHSHAVQFVLNPVRR